MFEQPAQNYKITNYFSVSRNDITACSDVVSYNIKELEKFDTTTCIKSEQRKKYSTTEIAITNSCVHDTD